MKSEIVGRKREMQALDHFWNSWASRKKNVLVIVCGSAASWMIENILHNKGGLHNRVDVVGRLHVRGHLPETRGPDQAGAGDKWNKHLRDCLVAQGGAKK